MIWRPTCARYSLICSSRNCGTSRGTGRLCRSPASLTFSWWYLAWVSGLLFLSSSSSSWTRQEDTHVNTALTIRCTFSVFFLEWSWPSVSCRRELQPSSPLSLGFSLWRRTSSSLASARSAHTSLAFLLLFWTAVAPVKIGTRLEYMIN